MASEVNAIYFGPDGINLLEITRGTNVTIIDGDKSIFLEREEDALRVLRRDAYKCFPQSHIPHIVTPPQLTGEQHNLWVFPNHAVYCTNEKLLEEISMETLADPAKLRKHIEEKKDDEIGIWELNIIDKDNHHMIIDPSTMKGDFTQIRVFAYFYFTRRGKHERQAIPTEPPAVQIPTLVK